MLEQNIGFLNVQWNNLDEDDNENYSFLDKKSYSFSKKKILKSIDEIFSQIEELKNRDKETKEYKVCSFNTLDNSIRLWKGEEPIHKKLDSLPINNDVDEQEEEEEILTIKDIIKKTTENK